MGLQLEGDLNLDADGCLRLRNVQGEGGPGPIDILWPVGASLREVGGGDAEVVMSDGSVFARTGPISATGGYTTNETVLGHKCVGEDAFQLEVILPPE